MKIRLKQDVDQIARELLAAFERSTLITPPSERYEDFDLRAGYAVAFELARLRKAKGYRTVGRKVGFTNQSAWSEFGLDTPIWAPMYENTVHHADRNSLALSLTGMALPRIETEVVFKLGDHLPSNMSDSVSMVHSIEWFALGFEIVDCHYPNWVFKPADAVADFGVHAALVVGEPQRTENQSTRELVEQLSNFRVTLLKNRSAVATGAGKDVLGNPLLSLGFLADVLSHQPEADRLSPGEVIATGTLTRALPIKVGESWSAEVTGSKLPQLTLALSG